MPSFSRFFAYREGQHAGIYASSHRTPTITPATTCFENASQPTPYALGAPPPPTPPTPTRLRHGDSQPPFHDTPLRGIRRGLRAPRQPQAKTASEPATVIYSQGMTPPLNESAAVRQITVTHARHAAADGHEIIATPQPAAAFIAEAAFRQPAATRMPVLRHLMGIWPRRRVRQAAIGHWTGRSHAEPFDNAGSRTTEPHS